MKRRQRDQWARLLSFVKWVDQDADCDSQGRPAKAINHNADAHVLEKSDCAVLPVNQPNKEGQPSAEVGEGRAQAKENIDQSHMPLTQSGKRMSQGLHGVRPAARFAAMHPQ